MDIHLQKDYWSMYTILFPNFLSFMQNCWTMAIMVWFTNLLTSDALENRLWNLCWNFDVSYCVTTGPWIIFIIWQALFSFFVKSNN